MAVCFEDLEEARAAFALGGGVVFRCAACGGTHSAAAKGWVSCARKVAREWGMCQEAPAPDAEILVFEYADPLAGAVHGDALGNCVLEARAGIPAPRNAALLPSWPAVLSLAPPVMVLTLTHTWDRWWDSLVEPWLSAVSESLAGFWHARMPGPVPRYVEVGWGHPLWQALCGRDVSLRGHGPCGAVLMGRHACAFRTQKRADWDWREKYAVLQVHFYAGVRVAVRVHSNALARGVARDPEWALRIANRGRPRGSKREGTEC